MTNQYLTDGEVEAVVALWSEQKASVSAGPRLSDVAEALDVTPERAQELLARVQQRQDAQTGQRRRAVEDSISPALSTVAVTLFGLTSLVWTAFSWQEWVSFPLPAAEAGELIVTNAGLWLLFAKWLRSIYRDVKRRGERP